MVAVKSNRLIYSALWSLLSRYLPNLIQIISTLIIARLVTPAEFGEVAIITTFIQIVNLLVSSGFAEALIYRVKNSQVLYSTVFYFNVLLSLFLYFALYIFSDNIADFYSIDRLGILTKIVGLNVVIYSFTYIQRVIYTLNINFKTPALITLIASVGGSTVGLFLAFKGYGVWSIVYQTLSINGIQLLLFWVLSDWRPVFSFSVKELLSIIPYSSKILSNNIAEVFYDNIYSLVLGKVFSAKTLGYYNRMQTVVYFTTTNFMYAIECVFYPALCRKKESLEHIRESYEKLIRLSTFIAFPILIIMISLGKSIITILLTERWIGGLQILQLISLAYLFIPIIYINNSFLKILNRPNIIFYVGVFTKLIGLAILVITINYSITIVCYGIIIYYIINAIVTMICTHFIVKITFIKQVSFILPNVLLNIILYFTIVFISSFIIDDFTKVFVCILGGFICYFALGVFFKAKELFIFKELLNRK